ncbi:MAG: fimbrillin family protein [Candidatus Phocaeicola faecigallinarum]|uniref:Fimbrillin family protein n=1 Tax=Candidatus Phocaeicola faecigallinarum TaxID=2838732 RepID=A0A948TD14_9BACT|nr:fimbrillin family protein [Candidatus Phocaeicola faecigallinarum]
MKAFDYLLGFSIFLAACSNETLSLNEDLSVKLFVEVGSNQNQQQKSRTVTDADGHVTFSTNDKVGMFIQNQENPVLWTYDGASWNPEKTIVWENRADDFDFQAYYPCEETAQVTRTSVPMPDLSVQTGKLGDIGSKDFLVGKCTTSYSDYNGVVSFSGTNAFKHVYSLLHINIVNDEAEQSFKMVGCSFLGEGIVTPHVYSFDSASEGMKKSGEDEKSILEIADLSSLTESAITVLLNPVSLEIPLSFTLNYTNGGEGYEYEASVDIGKEFLAGSFSKITLRLVDGKLTMTGNEVEDWNVITLDEIVITGTPK